MKVTNEILQTILLDSGLFSKEQFYVAEKSAKAQGISLYEYLSESNLIRDSQLSQLVANYLNLPYVNLSHVSIDQDVLKIIPELVARKQLLIAFKRDGAGLHVATFNPQDEKTIDYITKKTRDPITLYYASEKNIKDALDLYAQDVALAFEDILAENIKQARGAYGRSAEPPIIKIVDTIIDYAYKNKASDVHIEPEEEYSLLRFRVDGMLHDIVRLPIEVHDQVVTRIKVLSNLRTDIRQGPQDGKIEKKMYDERLNLRVSIVPVTEGEKIVLRLLSEKTRRLSLNDLGFHGESLKRIENGYNKPYGMILTTGPTGSGKTTTLYAVLRSLNRREVNIMTIEDPVEYDLEGISQIQVNAKTGLTFESGLRSIVRQDPDIVLVGEIRDPETAKIAINSAMTGHLVLSTLHTNDAATSIPRLFDMGIEPFLVASSANVIVGQRLVRRICEECRVSVDLSRSDLEALQSNIPLELIEKHLGAKKVVRAYKGKGCSVCHDTGYSGRIGVYEVLEVDENIRNAIVKKKSAAEITELGIQQGMESMLEDGLEKVKMGVTTLEEVIRVTKE